MNDFIQVQQYLMYAGMGTARLASIFAMVPFLGPQMIQGIARNVLLISLSLILLPLVVPDPQPASIPMTLMIAVVAKEAIIGIFIGFATAKIFWAVESVGFLVDTGRGSSMASIFDPSVGDQTSPLGSFLSKGIIVLFFCSGGFLVFLGAVFESYKIWPVLSFFPSFRPAAGDFMLGQTDQYFSTVALLVSPLLIMMFLVDFGLGLVNRFAPQLNVFFVAMPIKSALGLLVMILYLDIFFGFARGEFIDTVRLKLFLEHIWL